MKKWTMILAVAMIALCSLQPSAVQAEGKKPHAKKHRAALDKETKAFVETLEDRLLSMKGFSAKFRQTFHNASMGTVEESYGTVVMRQPLKMRWEYLTPELQTIISDGHTVYYYLPADKQVIVEPLGNVVNVRSPALFLAGGRGLKELFYISPARPGESGSKIKGDVFLSLEPKEQSIAVTRIVIAVDAREYTIRALSLYDWAGNRSDIEFSGMKLNEDVDNSVFRFERPPGVEVVEPPKF